MVTDETYRLPRYMCLIFYFYFYSVTDSQQGKSHLLKPLSNGTFMSFIFSSSVYRNTYDSIVLFQSGPVRNSEVSRSVMATISSVYKVMSFICSNFENFFCKPFYK